MIYCPALQLSSRYFCPFATALVTISLVLCLITGLSRLSYVAVACSFIFISCLVCSRVIVMIEWTRLIESRRLRRFTRSFYRSNAFMREWGNGRRERSYGRTTEMTLKAAIPHSFPTPSLSKLSPLSHFPFLFTFCFHISVWICFCLLLPSSRQQKYHQHF